MSDLNFLKYPLFKDEYGWLFPLLTKVSLDLTTILPEILYLTKTSFARIWSFIDGQVELENEQKEKRIAGPELIVLHVYSAKRNMPLTARAVDNCSMQIDRSLYCF